MRLFLGIDTSNYTTSAALLDENGNVMLNFRKLLPVKEGERGLRQSDAVFHHTKAMPEAAEAVRKVLMETGGEIAAVGCSVTPRDCEGSYMPCFLTGEASASMVSSALGVPLYRFSHQAGHIAAALRSACEISGTDETEIASSKFVAFHVSGGTTDLLLCSPDELHGFDIKLLGGTTDLNAGQAIDRTGVKLGLKFPAGAEMDKAALAYEGVLPPFRVSVKGLECSLSGLENKAADMMNRNCGIPEISAFVLSYIAKTLEKMTDAALDAVGDVPVLYAGGVMSSGYIKRILNKRGIFADPSCSADNATGTARLAMMRYTNECR